MEDEGYTVFAAFDGAQALLVAREHRPDLIILDIMLPRRDGFAVCRELREELDIPKPFSIKELMARVEAHLRRERRGQQRKDQANSATCLSYGHLSIDLSAYEVRYASELLPLTLKEFEIIQLLVLHPRQVFSREVIYDCIWKMDALGDTKTVTEHIKRIRKKIAHHDSRTEYISTVWGVGYKWELRTAI